MLSSGITPACISQFFSLGSRAWDGLPLHGGYLTHIGGKDVELDSQIKASQMPDIIGSVHEHGVDEGMAFESQPPSGSSFLLQALKKGPESPGLASAPKFVAPTSFYGQAAPKHKPKGPLFVLSLHSILALVLCRFLDMMLLLRML
jgi:DNA repair and recombination protein RAD54B